MRDKVTRRAQPVAVQCGAYQTSIGKGDGRRAIPRLHQRSVVFVERFLLRGHRVVGVPSLGNEHRHHVGQFASTQV